MALSDTGMRFFVRFFARVIRSATSASANSGSDSSAGASPARSRSGASSVESVCDIVAEVGSAPVVTGVMLYECRLECW